MPVRYPVCRRWRARRPVRILGTALGRIEAGAGEQHAERLAPDHHGTVVGDVEVLGDVVVLVADIALERSQRDHVLYFYQ